MKSHVKVPYHTRQNSSQLCQGQAMFIVSKDQGKGLV